MNGAKSPNCHTCNAATVWIDHGPRLQYFYCRTCKTEPSETPVSAASRSAVDRDVSSLHVVSTLPCGFDDKGYIVHSWNRAQPDAMDSCACGGYSGPNRTRTPPRSYGKPPPDHF